MGKGVVQSTTKQLNVSQGSTHGTPKSVENSSVPSCQSYTPSHSESVGVLPLLLVPSQLVIYHKTLF